MIRKIRTFFGRQSGQHGAKKTTISMGYAWLCEKCGEVILYEHLTPKHFCRREIKPVVLQDTESSLPP
jgi:ABC-type dipeptide/oligopeptide/nickel transport system ATPase subunit